jgi:hypothetical protein
MHCVFVWALRNREMDVVFTSFLPKDGVRRACKLREVFGRLPPRCVGWSLRSPNLDPKTATHWNNQLRTHRVLPSRLVVQSCSASVSFGWEQMWLAQSQDPRALETCPSVHGPPDPLMLEKH